ncbi:hypothetical protein [Saccharothrix obliqua]|uniref:hypothetical protein n=1 Tax=Saccharothrix obliqua TaxID=2861747 RepID=UPI001C5CF0F5|nr:hypothetical protein [Saccharothrix obliqua]MBW4717176.1 hypothetical protein [Saccharothrix obliqua]
MNQARAEADDLSALFTLLDVTALPPGVVAQVTNRDVATLSGVPAHELLPPGGEPRWRSDGWLARAPAPAPELDPPRVRALVERAAAALPGPGREEIAIAVPVLRLAVALGVPAAAVALATRLWAWAGIVGVDSAVADAVGDAGAAAAAAVRDPRALAGLLRSASEWAERHGDLAKAEEVAAAEWEVWRRLGDRPGMAAVLWRRADMFAARRRGDRELGCYERLESLHQGQEPHARAGLVRVLAAKGSALLAYGRVEPAAESLLRAEKVVRAWPDFPPGEQAVVLEWVGRALWSAGEPRSARRRWFDALALLVDHDEPAAERLRLLLGREPGADLPPARPDRFRGPDATRSPVATQPPDQAGER